MKKWMVWSLLPLLLLLAGCGQTDQSPALAGLAFERSGGSSWGNQFSIEVRPDQIVRAAYFPAGADTQTVCRQIPITGPQWDALCELVQTMPLQPQRTSWWQRLFKKRVLDGVDRRTLTLIWQTEQGTEQVTYQWPRDDRAAQLEAMLEALVTQSAPGSIPGEA